MTSKWPHADITILRSVARRKSATAALLASIATQASRCASLRSLLQHQIREERTVCTGGCRQTAEFTSVGSFGFICTVDQRCLIELGTPWPGLTLEPFNKAQGQWIARRGLGSVSSQFLIRVEGHQNDPFSSAFSSTTPLFELLVSHAHLSMNVVAATGDASPVSRSFLPALQFRATAVRMAIFKFQSPVRPTRHLRPSQEGDAHQGCVRGGRVRFTRFCRTQWLEKTLVFENVLLASRGCRSDARTVAVCILSSLQLRWNCPARGRGSR